MAWTDKLANFLRLNDGEQAYTGYPQMQVGLNKPRQAGYATGFLEGATGMESMQPKNPITDPNYDQYAQGKNTGEAVGIGAMGVPGYAMALRAGAPKAYNALENYMVKSGGILPMEAWHGTPHKIEGKFDINKVGTGEGAQAYGHGMYFAENPSVAGEYKRKLSGGLGSASNELTLNGQPLTNLTNAQRRAYEIVARDGRKNALGTAKDLEAQGFDASHIREALNSTKGKEISLVKNEGNLYKVDIPDADIPNMLDWDKPLNQQNSSVLSSIKIPQKAADRYNEISNKLEELQWTKGGLDSPEWNKLFEEAKDIKAKYGLHRSGEELYREAYKVAEKAGTANPSQAAAESLKAQGIPGIRYLDEGSRNKGKGTSNFVVFDPSTVKILEENSKPVSRKALIEEQVKKLKD